jgi:hypothetical protein
MEIRRWGWAAQVGRMLTATGILSLRLGLSLEKRDARAGWWLQISFSVAFTKRVSLFLIVAQTPVP